MQLACGASPVMADDIREVEEITSICSGLYLNIGTLNERTVQSMLAAGKKANEPGRPVVIDPAGAGASRLRTETVLQLIEEIDVAVIRGNISEIKALALGGGSTKGVDADAEDAVDAASLDRAVTFAKDFAKRTNAVISISGAIDIVADAEKAYCVYNGLPQMSKVTGTGCQLSAVTTAYVAANPDHPLEAAAAAVCLVGLCGEIGMSRMREHHGNASYRDYIIDAVDNLTVEEFRQGAKYEIR